RSARAPYCPHSPHARCGRCLAPHAGLAQATSEGATAFHCERRWRVLLRDIFRFGTATVISSCLGPYGHLLVRSGPTGSSVFVLQGREARPARVDRSLMTMVGVIRESRTTLGAQPGTVVLAERLERQCKHHRVPQQGLEVEQVVLECADFVVQVLIGLVASVV